MRTIQRFAVALLVIGAAGGFAQQQTQEKRYIATIGPDGVQKVEITAGSYFFDPSDIVVKVNVPVQFVIAKTGSAPHDITLQAPEAGIDIKESLSAKPKVIAFTPTKAGKYSFWCTKKPPFGKSHRDRGMEGVLEVVE